MTRILALALAIAALMLPATALAAKGKAAKPVKLKVGQACTTKKAAMYRTHHFKCVKGHLTAVKKAAKKA